MTNQQHPHAAFDRFPDLVQSLTEEFGTEGIDAIVDRFIDAEQADFCWDGRFAEINLGAYQILEGEDESLDRVAVVGYFRGGYYVAICIVDGDRSVTGIMGYKQFESFEAAEIAFKLSS